MDLGDISYGLETYYNNSVVDTVFSKYLLGKTTSKEIRLGKPILKQINEP